MALTVPGYCAIFLGKGKNSKNTSAKNSVNSTQGTMIFSKEEEDLNNPLKDSVNGTQSTVLIS